MGELKGIKRLQRQRPKRQNADLRVGQAATGGSMKIQEEMKL